ncbi:MAG: hypothetical protein BRC25_03520 [Parcubacteria group bacterium SW_6_46_9]|nr:MAG: hypothetical protein BRC25_03520 [Parcubacteria group bacterium SW_6_46_9]
MISLYGLIVLGLSLWYMEHVKGIPGKPKDEPLVGKEKYVVPLLSVLNPVFAGLSFYYGWRNAFPQKAQTANHWSLGAFAVELALYAGYKYFIA